jgi:hypothetical protein
MMYLGNVKRTLDFANVIQTAYQLNTVANT